MTQAHRTASGVVTEAPLILTDIITDTGISGHSMMKGVRAGSGLDFLPVVRRKMPRQSRLQCNRGGIMGPPVVR